MDTRPHPSKEEVRAWMARRHRTRVPPPAPDEIRRELGWHLLPAPAAPPPVPHPAPLPPLVPVVFAELTALTAIMWCWLALQPAPNRR